MRTHDIVTSDIFSLASIAEVAVAPDGTRVAYSEARWSEAEEERRKDLWVVGAAGKQSRRLTGSRGDDSQPHWSADGAAIYFLGARRREGAAAPYDGRRQVWRIAADAHAPLVSSPAAPSAGRCDSASEGTGGTVGAEQAITAEPDGVVRFALGADGAIYYQTTQKTVHGDFAELRQRFPLPRYRRGATPFSRIWRLDIRAAAGAGALAGDAAAGAIPGDAARDAAAPPPSGCGVPPLRTPEGSAICEARAAATPPSGGGVPPPRSPQASATCVYDAHRVVREIAPSPDGKRLALITTPDETVISLEGRSRIDLLHLETRRLNTLCDDLWRRDAPSPYGALRSLAWSADGRRLAFNIYFDGYPNEIVVVDFAEDGAARAGLLERPPGVSIHGYGSPVQWLGESDLCFLGEERARVRVYCARNVGPAARAISLADATQELPVNVSNAHGQDARGTTASAAARQQAAGAEAMHRTHGQNAGGTAAGPDAWSDRGSRGSSQAVVPESYKVLTPGDVAATTFHFTAAGDAGAAVMHGMDHDAEVFLLAPAPPAPVALSGAVQQQRHTQPLTPALPGAPGYRGGGENAEAFPHAPSLPHSLPPFLPPARLTHVNPQMDEWKLPPASIVAWEGADGDAVEGVLTLPPDHRPGQRLPMILHIHGGPTTCQTLAFHWSAYGVAHLAARGCAVLSPNYRGSTGYGDKFLTDLIGHPNDLDLRDLLAGVDAMVARGIADAERLGVMGWSNGGYLTNCIIARTDRFKAASTGAGIADTAMEWGANDEPAYQWVFHQGCPWEKPDLFRATSPIFAVHKIRTPTLIHVGAEDERCPPGHSRMLYLALTEYLGVDAELIVYPGEGHGLDKRSSVLAKMEWDIAWFDRHIPSAP